jgi:hypothetical protein
MEQTPYFSETERTPQQRRESVKWAVGVAMSQGGSASPELVALYNRYIAGEIDLAYIRAELTRLHPQQPTTDPRYAPGQPTARWQPNLHAKPSRPYEPVDVNEPAVLV